MRKKDHKFSGILWCSFIVCLGQQHFWRKLPLLVIFFDALFLQWVVVNVVNEVIFVGGGLLRR